MSNVPFKGLPPYSEEENDARFFFGRKVEIENIIERLKASRLTVLYGESGVGKSSVLRAGVVYQLHKEIKDNLAEYERPYFAVTVFPPLVNESESNSCCHDDPLTGLMNWQDDPLTGLMKQIEQDITKIISNVPPPKKELPFVETLQAWTKLLGDEEESGELFIILDQFEEYFLYHPQQKEQEPFVLEFARAVKRSSLPIHFLISIRADSFSKLNCFKSHILNVLSNNFELKHLDRDSAKEIILKPIEKYNFLGLGSSRVEIEPNLAGKILDQISKISFGGNGLGGVGQFRKIEAPLVQLVMIRLWQEEVREGASHHLCLNTLDKLRGAEKIVKDHLNARMKKLPSIKQEMAASIFHYLVTPSGTKIAYTVKDLFKYANDNRDRSNEPFEHEPLKLLLEELSKGDSRILRPVGPPANHPEAGERYEIFHDVLAQPILNWRRRYLATKQREQERKEEKQQRIRSIKEGLAAQSLRQQRRRNDEPAALLARQAYYFNQQDQLHVLAQVDDALRQALSAPYFSNILKHDSVAFSSIAFSPDGTKLAAGSWDGNIYLWNQEQSYSECTRLAGHKEGINAVIFSPDSQYLASGSRDKTVKLWNWQQPEQDPIVLKGYDSKEKMGMVRSLTFSPYASQLAVGCDERTIWLWDVQKPAQTPDKEPRVCYGHGEKIRSVTFSRGGRWLASASDDYTIRLWDMNQPQEQPKILKDRKQTTRAKVRSVTFSFDGKILASASNDQRIRLWKTDKLGKTDKFDEDPQILRGHTFNITSISFSPDSQYLASCGWDNMVRLWDLNPPVAKPKVLSEHEKTVRAIAISPQYQQDHLLASGSEDGTVRVWDLDQPDAKPKTFECGGKVFGVALFVTSDRQIQLLAAGSDDKKVRVWDLQQHSNEPIRTFNRHEKGVSSVAFSTDGRRLASGSWDATVRLWDLHQSDPKPIPFPKRHTDSVTSVKFSPDGKILASASDDNTVLLWNPEQPDVEPVPLKNHSGRVWSIDFSLDGQLLASASDDWTVRLWNLRNLDLEHPDLNNLVHISLRGHSAWVSSVAFSPDGKVLASGSFDRSIRLWQIEQIDWKTRKINEYPIVLEDHLQSVTSVAFTPDGKYLASGSFDNTIRLWIARTKDLADMVCQKVLRNLTQDEWQQFMGDDIPYELTCPTLPQGE